MCNGWNHSPGCTCGWGGEGHSGRSPGGFTTHPLGCFSWQHRDEDFCRPTKCPRCGASVFFVRHNGGSVWFDELGHPWPKHECFSEDPYVIQLRRLLTSPGQVFGVVIETETTRPGEGGRIVVRCSNRTLIDQEFETSANLSLLPGRLVLTVYDMEGQLTLDFVAPARRRKFAYWEITKTGDCDFVEEFLYRQKAEAEQRLAALQAKHSGRYVLEFLKRYEY
jgi:hypothetical protein